MTEIVSDSQLELLNVVGRGSFGDVYSARNKSNGETVAVKVINLEGSEEDIDEVKKELIHLSECKHPNITKYFGSFNKGSDVWIVMEYLAGGSAYALYEVCTFDETQISVVMREVLKGLRYLHENKKIHRDIKGANILLGSDGSVKLGDFGVTGQLSETMLQRNTVVGTPFWMAPEVILRSGYSTPADIWSVGITAIELLLKSPPLAADFPPMKAIFEIPRRRPPSLDAHPNVSSALKDFVRVTLQKDPTRRPTASALLQHAFIPSEKKKKIGLVKTLIEQAHQRRLLNGATQLPSRPHQPPRHETRPIDEWVFDETVRIADEEQPSRAINEEPVSVPATVPHRVSIAVHAQIASADPTEQNAISSIRDGFAALSESRALELVRSLASSLSLSPAASTTTESNPRGDALVLLDRWQQTLDEFRR